MNDLIYVGFNSRVAALHRVSGRLVWNWKSPRGSGYTTILLDGDRLIVSVVGYTYCLDAMTGDELWFNELEGMGVGVASLSSQRGGNTGILPDAAHQDAQQETHSDVTVHSSITP